MARPMSHFHSFSCDSQSDEGNKTLKQSLAVSLTCEKIVNGNSNSTHNSHKSKSVSKKRKKHSKKTRNNLTNGEAHSNYEDGDASLKMIREEERRNAEWHSGVHGERENETAQACEITSQICKPSETINVVSRVASDPPSEYRWISATFQDVGDIIEQRIKDLFERHAALAEVTKHECGRQCAQTEDLKLDENKKLNKFLKPYYYGFSRFKIQANGDHFIVYQAPCSKMLTTQVEVDHFIKVLGFRQLRASDFNFSLKLEFVESTRAVYRYVPDISYGEEARPVPFYNFYDQLELAPLAGVYTALNAYDESIMAHVPWLQLQHCSTNHALACNCSARACTDQGSECFCHAKHRLLTPPLNPCELELQKKACSENDETLIAQFADRLEPGLPYTFQTLPYVEDHGIYECTSKCKCNRDCALRCVGNGLEVNIAVTRAPGKGFGVIACQFIPRGTFVGNYAGVWYDAQCLPPHLKKSEYNLAVPADPVYFGFPPEINHLPKTTGFILNNEETGNYGRYFNHSCVPNMFIQKVFLEHDDRRLPTLAFFTSRDVHFGEELCWDYNSEDMLSRFSCICGHAHCKGLPQAVLNDERPQPCIAKQQADENNNEESLDQMESLHMRRLLHRFNLYLTSASYPPKQHLPAEIDESKLAQLEQLVEEAARNYKTRIVEFKLDHSNLDLNALKRVFKKPRIIQKSLNILKRNAKSVKRNHKASRCRKRCPSSARSMLLGKLMPVLARHFDCDHLLADDGGRATGGINMLHLISHIRIKAIQMHLPAFNRYDDELYFCFLYNPFCVVNLIKLLGIKCEQDEDLALYRAKCQAHYGSNEIQSMFHQVESLQDADLAHRLDQLMSSFRLKCFMNPSYWKPRELQTSAYLNGSANKSRMQSSSLNFSQ